MAKKQYVFRGGRARVVKEGLSLSEYLAKHPDAIPCCKPPGLATLEGWERKGYGRTPCGCKTEPDGYCDHGRPSWLLIYGLI